MNELNRPEGYAWKGSKNLFLKTSSSLGVELPSGWIIGRVVHAMMTSTEMIRIGSTRKAD